MILMASTISFFSAFSAFTPLAGTRLGSCRSCRVNSCSLSLLQLLPQTRLRYLEPSHRRPLLLLVRLRLRTQLRPQTQHFRPGLLPLLAHALALGVGPSHLLGHLLHAVLHQGIQRELRLHVLEVVLLPPTPDQPPP